MPTTYVYVVRMSMLQKLGVYEIYNPKTLGCGARGTRGSPAIKAGAIRIKAGARAGDIRIKAGDIRIKAGAIRSTCFVVILFNI